MDEIKVILKLRDVKNGLNDPGAIEAIEYAMKILEKSYLTKVMDSLVNKEG